MVCGFLTLMMLVVVFTRLPYTNDAPFSAYPQQFLMRGNPNNASAITLSLVSFEESMSFQLLKYASLILYPGILGKI